MIRQYLQNRKIAKDFAIYYDLFNKYRADYQVNRILEGKADETVKERAKKARFDERLSLLGLLLDSVTEYLKKVCNEEAALTELMASLKTVRVELAKPFVITKEGLRWVAIWAFGFPYLPTHLGLPHFDMLPL